MVILHIEGRKYQVASECAEFMNVREIREKFQQVLEINKAIGLPENHQAFKLFFVLFSQFMKREIKGKDQSEIRTLFETGSFMKALFCFALELNQLTNKVT